MKISIIGCGWLGFPLAESLLQKGHQVLGSTTTKSKLADLEKVGIEPALFKLSPMPEGKNFQKLFDSELLIVNIPPRRKSNSPEFYREQIKYLKYLIDQSSIAKVIFISSTSYYPNTNSNVDVDTPHDFDRGSSKAVVWAEQEIRKIEKELIVLRAGGLMGNERIPGRWFSGKETTGRDTPVNYIHLKDILSIISSLVESWPSGKRIQTFNMVSGISKTRCEVHQAMSKKYGFKPPMWIAPYIIPHKIVESDFSTMNLLDPEDY